MNRGEFKPRPWGRSIFGTVLRFTEGHKLFRCAQIYLVCTSLFGVHKFIRRVWNYFFHFETGIPGSTEEIVINRIADYQKIVLTKHRGWWEWRIWLKNTCKSLELSQERRSQHLETIRVYIEASEKTSQLFFVCWSSCLSCVCPRPLCRHFPAGFQK